MTFKLMIDTNRNHIVPKKSRPEKALLLLLFFLVAATSYARLPQEVNIRSLLEQYPEDTSKVNALNDLASNRYEESPDEAIAYGTEASELAERLGYESGQAYALKNIGLGYFLKGNYIETIRNWDEALQIFEKLGDEKGIANIVGNKGSVYLYSGKTVEAVESFLQALKIAEKNNDTERIASNLSNIGLAYSMQPESLDSARNYYLRAYKLYESIGLKVYMGVLTVNLGELFFKQEAYDSALVYFERSLSLLNSNIYISSSLNYIGKIHTAQGDYDSASEYYEKALDMAREEDARREIASSLLGLADNYVHMGDPEQAIGYFEQSIEYLEQARNVDDEREVNIELSEAYEGVAMAYADISDYRNAFKYLNLQNDIDNVIYRLEAEDEMKNMMFSYQLEKKDDQIEFQRQISKRQKAANIAIGSIGILLLVLAIMFYQRFQYTRRTKAQIQDQKEEIEAQRDQIVIQRDLLASQKQAITDSINYAKRIQSAVLPSKKHMDQLMPEYFLLLKPRDIVSGDFYWIKEVNEHLMIVGADCTGHGVPGAFMSMLGVTLLNDLVIDCTCEKPGQVLNKLRAKVKQMLAYDGMKGLQKDGMDMALMVIDRKKRELQFAGANQPLYIIRDKSNGINSELDRYASQNYNGYQLYELKGDQQPIGAYWEETDFQSYKLKLREHDSLYIFSDGFIDQFGGEDRKKYKAVKFKKLLLSIQPESMQQQKLLIENEFENWRGGYEQIDDVSVIGVRIS